MKYHENTNSCTYSIRWCAEKNRTR